MKLELPPLDVEPVAAERLRRMARSEFHAAAAQSPASRWWNSVLEPALVALVVVIYVGWAGSTLAKLANPVLSSKSEGLTMVEENSHPLRESRDT